MIIEFLFVVEIWWDLLFYHKCPVVIKWIMQGSKTCLDVMSSNTLRDIKNIQIIASSYASDEFTINV